LKNGQVFLFEFADEIDAFLKHDLDGIKKLSEADAVIAIEVSAQIRLKSIGICAYNTSRFFGKKGHQNVLDASASMLARVRESLLIIDKNDLSESYHHFFVFYLRLFVHHIIFLLELLEQIRIVFPSSVLVVPYNNRKSYNLHIANRDRYLGELAEKYFTIHSSDYNYFNVTNRPRVRILPLIKQVIYGAGGIVVNWLAQKILYKKAGKYHIVLSLEHSYNMHRVVEDLCQPKDIPVYLYSEKKDFWAMMRGEFIGLFGFEYGILKKDYIFERNLQQSLNNINGMVNQGKFIFQGVNIGPWIGGWINEALYPEMKKLNFQAGRLISMLEKVSPRLTLSQHALGLGGILGEYCLQQKKPALLISHGSHVPPRGKYDSIEWLELGRGLIDAPFPYVALQTPWAEQYIEKTGIRWSKPLRTGPLLFAKKNSNTSSKEKLRSFLFHENQDKKIILHASTPKSRSSRRFWVYETVDEYIANINSLINAVEKTNDTHLVIRFRPLEDLTLTDLKSLLVDSKCYTIRSDGAFGDFLLASDLLISYSSTTIEEALQNHIPVLQYDFDGKYCHIPGSQLNDGSKSKIALNSCYYVDNEGHLVDTLNWIINNHLNIEDVNIDWGRHFFHDIFCDKNCLNAL